MFLQDDLVAESMRLVVVVVYRFGAQRKSHFNMTRWRWICRVILSASRCPGSISP